MRRAAVLIGGSSLLLGGLAFVTPAAALPPPPAATVSANSLTFSDVPVGTSSTQIVTISQTDPTATAANAMTLSDFTLGGSPTFTLTSGPTCGPVGTNLSQCQVSVTFTPTNATTKTGSLQISGGISYTLNPNPFTVALTGSGAAAKLTASPNPIAFGPQPAPLRAQQLVTVTDTGQLPLTLGAPSVTGSSDFGMLVGATCTSGTVLTPGDPGCTLTVTFTPDASQNGVIQNGNLHLPATAATGPSPVGITVPLSGTPTATPPALTVTPNAAGISFGPTPVGTTSPNVTETVTDTGQLPVTNLQIGVTGSEFGLVLGTCAQGQTLAAGASCTFSVNYTPVAPAGNGPGTSTGSLAVSGTGVTPVVIPLSGISTVPVIQISPSPTLNFGTVHQGSSSVKTISVSNSGSAPLTFGLDMLLDGGAGDYTLVTDTCNFTTIAAFTGTCFVTINFTPSKSAPPDDAGSAYQFNDNSGGTPSFQTVNFKGTPTAPLLGTFVMHPNAINFGPVVVSTTSAAVPVLFENNGSANITLTGIGHPLTTNFNLSGNCVLGQIYTPNTGTPANPSPGSFCNGSVTFSPGATPGQSYTDTITTTFTTGAGAGMKTETDTFFLTGTGFGTTTTSLPSGVAGSAYSTQLLAAGGTGNYKWTSVGSALPAGLSLSNKGVISGTPLSESFTSGLIFQVLDTTTGEITQTGPLTLTIFPAPLVLTVSGTPTPVGVVGAPYGAITPVTASGGTPPYTFVAVGLPPGLSIDLHSGAISGTPTTAGTFNAGIGVVDSSLPPFGGPLVGAVIVQFVIVAPGLFVTPITLPNGTKGHVYPNTQLGATGGTTFPGGVYHWSVPAGCLPTGLSLSPTGVLNGTPTQPGTFTCTYTVTDNSSPAMSVSETLTFSVASTTLSLGATPGPANGQVNVVYPGANFAILRSGGTGPFSFNLASGSLPPGLTLAPSGLLTGTPTTAGTYNFAVQVTDSSSPAQTAQQTYSIVIAPAVAPGPLTVLPSTLPGGTVGSAYTVSTLSVTGTVVGNVIYSVTSGGLPPGLNLTPLGTVQAQIAGTPTTAGSYSFTITARDSATPVPATGSQSYTVVIAGVSPVVITSPTSFTVTHGVLVSGAFTATGGIGSTYTFAKTGGPTDGLTLASNGAFTGVPTVAGTFVFSIAVSDGHGNVGHATITMTVN
jgi:hypothetical protein